MIPVTIITGFLGAGKTTLINQLIEQHPDTKFGLIINEFGEVGIDGELIQADKEEIMELSNGCICCVVRKDIVDTTRKLVAQTKVDYLLVETSGLAEPLPVAQTFVNGFLEDEFMMDSIITVVDVPNYKIGIEQYSVGIEQIEVADIILLNKVDQGTPTQLAEIERIIKDLNPYAAVIQNKVDLNTSALIANQKWTVDKVLETEEEHAHEHEHSEVDELVFVSDKPLQMSKFKSWINERFPKEVIRAKGFLNIEVYPGQTGTFLLQLVGANRNLAPFNPNRKDFDITKTRLVLIGKDLPREEILTELRSLV